MYDMPAELRWLEPGTIFIGSFPGDVTASGERDAIDKFIEYLDAAHNPIWVISDWRQAKSYPVLADFFQKAIKLLRHKNLAYVVVVPGNFVLSFWVDVLSKVVKFNVRF